MKKISITKHDFLRGLQCHKYLWLYKNNLEFRVQQGSFERTGANQLELLAQQLFPGGVLVESEKGSFDKKVATTKKLIRSNAKTIYGASFKFKNILIMVSILNKTRKGWEIYVVKASTSIKDMCENDVSLKYYAVVGTGLKVASTNLIHINNNYVRKSRFHIKRMFAVADLTKMAVERQGLIRDELTKMRKVLKNGGPQVDIGPHCHSPYKCEFIEHCWSHIPDNSIFDLARLRWSKKWELYNKGIVQLKSIPKDYPLTPGQGIQVKAEKTKRKFVDKKRIRKFLKEIYYPLFFLDFETFQQKIPQFENLKPYEQIPFQFSLHYREKSRGKLQHKEFLAVEGIDPRKSLAMILVKNIPRNVCVLAYNASFEKRVLKKLAELFPKHSNRLMNIHDCILDLMTPFQKKHIYTKEMKGSYSIKAVLPALVPELGYEGLTIKNGGEASSIYSTLHQIMDETSKQKIRENLLEYCKLDTLAMVHLLIKLKEFSK